MQIDRRAFVRTVGATAAAVAGGTAAAGSLPVAGAGLPPAMVASRQQADAVEGIEAFAFDAYGTLFDVFSVTALCDELVSGER